MNYSQLVNARTNTRNLRDIDHHANRRPGLRVQRPTRLAEPVRPRKEDLTPMFRTASEMIARRMAGFDKPAALDGVRVPPVRPHGLRPVALVTTTDRILGDPRGVRAMAEFAGAVVRK
jgi:hypothetical protein